MAKTRPPAKSKARDPAGTGRAGAAKRLAWFVALYLASAGAFALAVYGLRAVIPG